MDRWVENGGIFTPDETGSAAAWHAPIVVASVRVFGSDGREVTDGGER